MHSIVEKILSLKREKNAVILSHIYQSPEIQDIADFVGDSLDLSRKAADTNADIIVFCGVHFMAETAAILSPFKKVLIPDLNAGCPMADMIVGEELDIFKSKFKMPIVVAYVNTSAEIKAKSDICCTSSNAVNVVKNLEGKGDIIFIPDRNLGSFVEKKSAVKVNLWNGFCPTHNNFILPEFVLSKKKKYPKAEILVHPECRPEVVEIADKAMSTGIMCRYVKASGYKEFIIGTETGILHKLKKENPDKLFYPVSEIAVCPNMKKITIANVFDVLANEKNVVKVPEEIQQKAYVSIKKMLEVAAQG
jgi:quinolinate synthase